MRKYFAAYQLALQNVLQRRSSLLMDRVGGVAVLASLYYFWQALMNGHSGFFGYSKAQMLSYVLAINVLRSFVMTGRGWELVGDISGGRISSYLVRPISYGGYSLSLDMAQKTVYLFCAALEIGIFVALVRVTLYLPAHLTAYLAFAVATVLSSLLFFVMEFMVSSLAFWTSESGGPLFCFELFLQFAAGAFFPLDVLPKIIRHVLDFSPFPYLVFFPINIYLERVKPGETLRILAIQAAWLIVMLFFAARVWRRGLRSYAAEGG